MKHNKTTFGMVVKTTFSCLKWVDCGSFEEFNDWFCAWQLGGIISVILKLRFDYDKQVGRHEAVFFTLNLPVYHINQLKQPGNLCISGM